MDTRTPGIGLIGCGYWGVNYLRVMGELPATVRWAVDAAPERRAFVTQRYPHVTVDTQHEAMLSDPAVDAVIVSTPAVTHFDLVRQVLEAGKHCLVEKPLTVDTATGQELARFASKVGRVLLVGHTFLFNAGIQKMKEVMASPAFGRVYYLHATRTNLGPIRDDVNALWDLAPHDVAILNFLLDSVPEQVSAVGGSFLADAGHEDVAFATLRYPGGIIGNVHVSWADPNKVREVVAVGSEQRVVFDDLNNLERIRIFHKGVSYAQTDIGSYGEFRLLVRDGDIVSPRVAPSEPLKNQCRHFLDVIAGRARPISDAWTGVDVVRVVEAVSRSMREDGAPVNLELQRRES